LVADVSAVGAELFDNSGVERVERINVLEWLGHRILYKNRMASLAWISRAYVVGGVC